MNLNSPSGLPQFLITLNGIGANPGAVTVTLDWSGTQDPSCVKAGTTTGTQPQAITFTQPTSPDVVGHGQTLSATGGGSGNPVVLTVDPASNGSCSVTGTALSLLHVGMCVLDANQAGNASYTAAPQVQRTVVVSKAATKTLLTVNPSSLVATVTAVAPGGGTPTGTVTFTVDGAPAGSAPLSGNTATLPVVVPADKRGTVAANYPGSADYLASSASSVPKNPTITARLSSARPRSAAGWYRSPVTVSFTCTPGDAPLTGPCPTPVVLSRNGGGQIVTRTIRTTDGGIATVSVRVSIDRVAPVVHVGGVRPGLEYPVPPAGQCLATDALSGVASCRLTRRVRGSTEAYLAVAVDRAGNTASAQVVADLSPVQITGAPFRDGAYVVKLGHRYTLVVDAKTRPRYIDAAPFPQRPHGNDAFFRKIGPNRWALSVDFTLSLAVSTYWNIGVKIGGTVHVVTIRIMR